MMFFYSDVPKFAHAAPEIISVCRLNLRFNTLISNSAFHILLFYSHSMVAGGLELMS